MSARALSLSDIPAWILGPLTWSLGLPVLRLVQPDALHPTDAHIHTRHTNTLILPLSAWPWPLCPDPEPPTHWVVQLEALYMYTDTLIRLGENKNTVPPGFWCWDPRSVQWLAPQTWRLLLPKVYLQMLVLSSFALASALEGIWTLQHSHKG